VDSGEPQEPCIRWGQNYPREYAIFSGEPCYDVFKILWPLTIFKSTSTLTNNWVISINSLWECPSSLVVQAHRVEYTAVDCEQALQCIKFNSTAIKHQPKYQWHQLSLHTHTHTHVHAHVHAHAHAHAHTHTHVRLMALCLGLTGWAGTRKIKPIWILLKQETVSGSGISWAICKSASHSCRQITTPAPHRSVFYRLDALPAT